MDVTVYNKSNFRRLSDKIRLDPGANLVDKAELEALCAENKHVNALFDLEILRTGDAPKANRNFSEGQKVANLSELKASDAVKAIEECKDVSQLKRWSETEPRKIVKEALVRQHATLVDPIDTSKD